MKIGYRVCKKCNTEFPKDVIDNVLSVCPKCGANMRFHARKRIKSLADENSFREWDEKMEFSNPLQDPQYMEKLKATSEKSNLNEAVIIGEMTIQGHATAIGVMDTRFMMASMGHVVGEKITRLFEKATKKKLPVILFSCSGGARMQEGIISLMQMEKTSAAVKRHSNAGLLFISVLTNPTMGGVTASFAMLGDIILAEKGAMIGFAGPRVIEQNTGVKLPEDFQTAEFQLEHGFVDDIVSRSDMKTYLGNLLYLHRKKARCINIPEGLNTGKSVSKENNDLSAWDKVQIARGQKRPTSLDYIQKIFDNFLEFHGDRALGDDHAIVAGIAEFFGYPVTVVAQQKGKKDFQEAMYRNWGMPCPKGYRKSLRFMRQAEKFGRPIICFIDTIGAACGKEAEEQGQGLAIAELLQDMSDMKVPILAIVISEGGSGGALALGVGNEVWALENAVYSILTPEGYASILWKDNSRSAEAAELMKLKASDLYQLGVLDKVINEPDELTTSNMDDICYDMKTQMIRFLKKYSKLSEKALLNQRYERFRKF